MGGWVIVEEQEREQEGNEGRISNDAGQRRAMCALGYSWIRLGDRPRKRFVRFGPSERRRVFTSDV